MTLESPGRPTAAHLAILLAASVLAFACTEAKPDCLGDAKACGGTCVELASDNLNCGACGHACGGGQVCSTGTCQLTCAAGLVKVSGSCVDPLTDRAHCGATATTAGTACDAGSVCSAGACAVSCQAGLADCNGKCIDPQTDVFHCGADAACGAGTACGTGQACSHGACATPACQVFQFVYTSDAHYGIKRAAFQGGTNVDAQPVNQKMVAKINGLSTLPLPFDGGLKAGSPVGPIDFLVETGDISNRMETASAVPSAATTWAQFKADYLDGLTLRDAFGRSAPVLLAPGNHDVSNAVGYYKAMSPLIDQTTLVEIYNRMVGSAVPKTPTITGVATGTYDYATDKVHFSRDIGGVHFVFVNMWPDSVERAWLDANLATVPSTTPVVLFTHDQPETESKHFTNPVAPFTINATNKFENLIADTFADGTTTAVLDLLEQQQLAAWLNAHPNVVAYFHGNSNKNEFYDWSGKDLAGASLDLGVLLHTFRVDSPMKGDLSAADETKLSFQLYTVDTCAMALTGRELLWNTQPAAADQAAVPVVVGATRTVALHPRPGFTAAAASQTVAAGATATFTVAATGAAALQWQSRAPGASAWTAIAGATAASYTTPVTVAGDSGTQVRCVATNPSGQASSAATLTVTP